MLCFAEYRHQLNLRIQQESDEWPLDDFSFKEYLKENLKHYGLIVSDRVLAILMAKYCCEMGGLLDENGLLAGLSDDCFYWYDNHKKRDKSKREEKRKELDKLQTNLQAQLKEVENQLKELN
jgi:hypothetical protein